VGRGLRLGVVGVGSLWARTERYRIVSVLSRLSDWVYLLHFHSHFLTNTTMNKREEIMTPEIMQGIYTDEILRKAVAYAHSCCDQSYKHLHYKALGWPFEYIVTEQQIHEAKEELARAKERIYAEHSNDLLFVGMGSDYAPRYEDDVCNYRIRTEFTNRHGHRYFIEFSTLAVGYGFAIPFAIDRDKEIELNGAIDRQGEYYNYKGLQLSKIGHTQDYTNRNILNLVNHYFDCCFKRVVVDNYTICMDDRDIICESPKS
jgi:hypothetical protein